MAVSNEEINQWLQSNAGASDADIAAAMNQYGVDPAQMARATGLGQDVVQSRYNAVNPTAQNIANTSGMGATGIGMNFTGQSLAPDYAASMALPQQSAPLPVQPAVTPATSPAFTDAQVAAYIRDHNLSGAGLDAAASVFGLDRNQIQRAQQLLTAKDPSVKAASNAYAAQVTGRPDLVEQNLATYNPAVQEFIQAQTGSPATAQDLAYWGQQFGSVIDPGEVELFKKTYNPTIQKFIQSQTGKAPTLQELEYWGKQFGSEIDPGEVELFGRTYNPVIQQFAQERTGRAPTLRDLEDLGRKFGSEIDQGEVAELEKFFDSKAKSALEINKQFGVAGDVTAPTTQGILSGFKYAKDSGLSEDDLKNTLGDDVFNTYKTGFADYAKTGIANILADKQLSFDEARETVKFGRDYGYDTQKLADLTGTDKRVFDAIYKNYDDTTNRVVDSVLGAEDVKTEGDQVGRALALQKQYGFTDEDLAKATDLSLDQVKDYLDPVRNFDEDYKKLLEDPNRSDDQMKAFLTASLRNPFLKEKLGDKLQPALDELNRPPRERILSQVEQQRNALGGQYYQGVFGDPQVMADVLERKGVKSLADLGEKEKFRPATAQAQYTANGVPVQSSDGKNFYRTVDYGEGATDYIPVDAKDVQTTYGTYVTEGDGENSYSVFKPLSEQEQATLKDGAYQEKLGTVVVNKRTGEELTDTSHQLAYQSSSGGLKKKKNYLNVNFTKEGVPVLTASREKAGLGAFVQQALPVLAMALPFVLPGVGAALSSGLASVGGSTLAAGSLANAALTQGLISGGLTTLGGGQFEKGFLGGAVSPVISSGIGSLLPTGMDPNIAKAVTGAGTGVVKGALQGGDFEDLLKSGILSGAMNYGLGEATKGLNLTPQQLNFATGIALPLLQGEKVSPVKLMTTLASAAQQQSKGKTP